MSPEPRPMPCGSWISDIAAEDIAASTHPVSGAQFADDGGVLFAESVPAEGGRITIRRQVAEGEHVTLLPAPWDVRSRVHEYGGGAWAQSAGVLWFVHLDDQRVHRLGPDDAAPVAISPEAPDASLRYGDLTVSGGRLWAIQERHDLDTAAITRSLVVFAETGPIEVAGGHHFLAYPRVSPDGRHLAWIGWDHPQMPWDGTQLMLARLDEAGTALAGAPMVLAGGVEESVLQPEWESSRRLLFASDRSGWWSLHAVDAVLAEQRGAAVAPEVEDVLLLPRDIGGPLWVLGSRWYARVGDSAVLAEARSGGSELHWLHRGVDTRVIEHPFDSLDLLDVSAARSLALVRGMGSHRASGLYALDLRTGEAEAVRLDADELPSPDLLPESYEETFVDPDTGREVHAIVSPPRNPGFTAMPGERPPYLAVVHGGPTAQSRARVSAHTAFFTSRGIGVVEVNYGGSSGYGREYRERLRGQWGIVDVEDTVTVMRGLAEQGLADPRRHLITGGSAGGWTVLSALTTTEVFAAGASYYGVAELEQFVAETHDFESRYLDGLIGPLPEAAELYAQRAPVNHIHRMRCPVAVFQGLLDPIVPPSQAERLLSGLREADIPYFSAFYEGESHGFRRPETVIDSLTSELAFYGRVLGFDTPGMPRIRLRGRGR